MASNLGMSGFSGIDTQSLIDALMSVERQRSTRVASSKTKLQSAEIAWGAIASKMSTLTGSASDLSSRSRLMTNAVTSSLPDKARVSGTSAAGSLTFGVTRLATTAMSTVTGLSSPLAEVGAGTATLSTGLAGLGISDVTGPTGSHAISVTQASAKASTASTAVTGVTLSSDADLTVTLATASGTTARTVTIPAGTYATAADVTAVLTAGLSGFAGASVATDTGTVRITNTLAEGSTATLDISGAAAALLGFTTGATAGTDAVVSVDGTTTTLTSVLPSGTATAGSPTGAVTLTLGTSGHLSLGSGTATSYVFSSGTTLDQVSARLNVATSGVTSAVVGAAGSAQLVVTNKTSGLDAATSLTWSGFSAGTASQLRAGQDATLTLGTQTITRPSNTVTDLLAGATVTLLGVTTEDVTITSTLDKSALSGKVKGFVTALNDVLATVATYTKTDPSDRTKSGALSSDSAARSVRRSLITAVTGQTSSGTYRSLAEIGVTMNRTGTFTVDETRLSDAIAADPDAVATVLARGVADSDARAGFVSAATATPAGAYDVAVTRAASRASVTGTPAGTLASLETLTVAVGTSTVTYSAMPGQTAQDTATGLSTALSAAGVGAYADVTSGALRILTTSYGAAATLTVTSTGTALGLASATGTGTDVAGTISGAVAKGLGTVLSATTGTPTGLALSISATAAEVAAAGGTLSLGQVTYRPGVSSLIRSALDSANGETGYVTTGKSSRSAQLARINADLARLDVQLGMTEARLVKQYAALDQAVTRMKSAMPTWPTNSSSN